MIRFHWFKIILLLLLSAMLLGCVTRGPHPDDPYEPINRKIYAFNTVFDKNIVQPPTKLYATIVPAQVRAGINNVYNNINMIPTFANDLLQAEFQQAILDFWRFVINSSMGLGGIFDIASQCSLPLHENDLGITFAKWGDRHSPYIVIPFLGPSTIRDGMGLIFDYTFFTPYPYIRNDVIIEGILLLRYVDLRSRMFDTDRLMQEAPDPYSFMRDAYLQHRNYLIEGEQAIPQGMLYVDDEESTDEVALPKKSATPQTKPVTREPKPEEILTNAPPEGKKAPEFPITTN